MEFAYLFGQWFCGPMRYASLPPALVRGVAKPGGVRQPHIFHKRVPRIRTANTESAFCLGLCCREFILPRYQCAHWYHPPHKCGGRGWLRCQCAKCQFAALNRYHVRNAARSKNRTGSINIGQHRTIASADLSGSFAPFLQFQKREIHTVFPRF